MKINLWIFTSYHWFPKLLFLYSTHVVGWAKNCHNFLLISYMLTVFHSKHYVLFLISTPIISLTSLFFVTILRTPPVFLLVKDSYLFLAKYDQLFQTLPNVGMCCLFSIGSSLMPARTSPVCDAMACGETTPFSQTNTLVINQ